MASVGGGDGGGHGGKKSVDQEIPLIPFIDLLFCCVMFLLATAVWNQLARINANQQMPGQQSAEQPAEPPPERLKLVLRITGQGFTLASSDGASTDVAKNGDNYNLTELRTKLEQWRQMDQTRRDIVVEPEDGVLYSDVVQALDVVVGTHFDNFSISATSTLQ
jgi:biopolymer transport protein ExbD